MDPSIIPVPEREAIVRHRHERNVQILLPVLSVVVLVVLVAVLIFIAYLSQNPALSKWANTALIYVLAITMALMVFLFIVLLGLNVALGFGLLKTPTYTGLFSEQFLHYSALSRLYMDKAVEPIITLKTWLGVPGDMFRRNKRKE
jgi:chromate transport protein ChrA